MERKAKLVNGISKADKAIKINMGFHFGVHWIWYLLLVRLHGCHVQTAQQILNGFFLQAWIECFFIFEIIESGRKRVHGKKTSIMSYSRWCFFLSIFVSKKLKEAHFARQNDLKFLMAPVQIYVYTFMCS